MSSSGPRVARLRLARAASSVGLFGALAAGGSLVLVNQSDAREQAINVDERVAPVLDQLDTGERVETFLLVGSDSREGADPNSPDYGGIAGADAPEGRRADTIMILRHDQETGEAALLSLPRDLWVKIKGRSDHGRLNGAYLEGTDVLVTTIQREIGIKVNHYVEVDFNGFKRLVDAVGGVEACFDTPTRDKNTGLYVRDEGCQVLDGITALAYARSRHFEEWRDGKWREDERYDLGRIARQQRLMLDALRRTEARLEENLYSLDDLVSAASNALTVDPGVDLFGMAHRFRGLQAEDVWVLTLPTVAKTINGNDVLLIDERESQPIIDFFNGLAPADRPPETATAATEQPDTPQTTGG